MYIVPGTDEVTRLWKQRRDLERAIEARKTIRDIQKKAFQFAAADQSQKRIDEMIVELQGVVKQLSDKAKEAKQ